jgi:hypothetical protein
MNLEAKIRRAAQSKVLVSITRRTRSAGGFTITATDGTRTTLPSKRIALQFLLAIVRCWPVLRFEILPARKGGK